MPSHLSAHRLHEGSSTLSENATILQWNCRGLRLKKAELCLRLHSFPVPKLALSEGTLPGLMLLAGYMKYTSQTIQTFLYGSATICISRHLPQKKIDVAAFTSPDCECVAVEVTIAKRTFTVVSVFVRCLNTAVCDGLLVGLVALARGSIIKSGDFNSHHPSWGSTRSSSPGRSIMEDIKNTWLVIGNDGSHTLLRRHLSTSVIDLTLHSPELPVEWKISPSTEGSDHFSISISLGSGTRSESRNAKVVCWDKFCSELLLSRCDPAQAIVQAQEVATLRVNVPARQSDPDLRMLNLMASRKRAQRRYRRTRRDDDQRELKRAAAKLRRHTRRF